CGVWALREGGEVVQSVAGVDETLLQMDGCGLKNGETNDPIQRKDGIELKGASSALQSSDHALLLLLPATREDLFGGLHLCRQSGGSCSVFLAPANTNNSVMRTSSL